MAQHMLSHGKMLIEHRLKEIKIEMSVGGHKRASPAI